MAEKVAATASQAVFQHGMNFFFFILIPQIQLAIVSQNYLGHSKDENKKVYQDGEHNFNELAEKLEEEKNNIKKHYQMHIMVIKKFNFENFKNLIFYNLKEN